MAGRAKTLKPHTVSERFMGVRNLCVDDMSLEHGYLSHVKPNHHNAINSIVYVPFFDLFQFRTLEPQLVTTTLVAKFSCSSCTGRYPQGFSAPSGELAAGLCVSGSNGLQELLERNGVKCDDRTLQLTGVICQALPSSSQTSAMTGWWSSTHS